MAILSLETEEILKQNGLTFDDIKWVGTRDCYIDIGTFLNLANVKYDDGYGTQEVATDLLVVGEYWWLERHEYDGAEWWEYKELPHKPQKKMEVHTLVGGMWDTLKTLNEENAE